MAFQFQKLFPPQQLTTTATVIFTMPAIPTTSILKNGRVRLTNTTGAPVSATMYADVAADASGADNCFLNAKSIAGNDFLDVDIPTMAAGDTLRALASAAGSITVHEIGGVITS